MPYPSAMQLRLELFRLQCAWRRSHDAASRSGESLPPFPREQIEDIAAQLPPPRPPVGPTMSGEPGEPGELREYADATFHAEPTGTARGIALDGKACSAWVHCHHADPALSAMRCELRTVVPIEPAAATELVVVRSLLRSQFAWVEATSSETGLAAIRADAWLEITVGDGAAMTAASASFYDHVSTGRQLYFPNQKLWTTELQAAIFVPAGPRLSLTITEAIEILASAEEGSNAYVSGRFAWEPLRVGARAGGWDRVTLPTR